MEELWWEKFVFVIKWILLKLLVMPRSPLTRMDRYSFNNEEKRLGKKKRSET